MGDDVKFSFHPPSRGDLVRLREEAEQAHDYLYSDDLAVAYLAGRKIDCFTAQNFLLGLVKEGERFYLAIPYIACAGVVARKLRKLPRERDETGKWIEPEGPKYLAPKGGGTPLYNTRCLATESDILFVTEGELDALTIQGHLGFPAVGVPGGTAWRPAWRILLEPYREVVFVGDGDDTGRKFAARAKEFPNARGVECPTKQDVNSIAVEHGAVGLADLLGVELT